MIAIEIYRKGQTAERRPIVRHNVCSLDLEFIEKLKGVYPESRYDVITKEIATHARMDFNSTPEYRSIADADSLCAYSNTADAAKTR